MRIHEFWIGFKWFTVGVSYLLSFFLFVSGISLLIDQFFFFGIVAIFFGLGAYSFSSILEDDIREDDGPDDPDGMTMVYKFA